MAAPVVVEVPAVSALLAAVVPFLTWIVAMGALYVWRQSVGAVLLWLADQLDRVNVRILTKTFHLFGPLAALLRSVVSRVDRALGAAALWGESRAAALFSFFLTTQVWIAREIADLAVDVFHLTNALALKVAHLAVKQVPGSLVKTTIATVRVVKTVTSLQYKALTARFARLEHRVASLAHASTGAITYPWGRVGTLERKVAGQAKRLTRLEKGALAATAVAAVAVALKRLGLGWARCPNVGRLGKRACSMDTDLLETLLGASLVLTSAISIAQLARELQEPTELVTDALKSLVKEF